MRSYFHGETPCRKEKNAVFYFYISYLAYYYFTVLFIFFPESEHADLLL